MWYLRVSIVASVFCVTCFSPALVGFALRTTSQIPGAQGSDDIRTVLLRRAITVPGYEVVLIHAEIPVGGREGRHTHPGTAVGHIEQETVRLEYEGKSPAILKTGESFFVDAGKVHEGVNIGDVPVKVLATLVVKTGSLLTTPVK